MKLWMYAWTIPSKFVDERQVDVALPSGDRGVLHFWRNHYDLHEWMQLLYYKKGGKKNDFFDATLRLTAEELDELEKAVQGNEYTLAFVKHARAAIKNGYAVIYTAIW